MRVLKELWKEDSGSKKLNYRKRNIEIAKWYYGKAIL